MAVVTQDLSGSLATAGQRETVAPYDHTKLRNATGATKTINTGFAQGEYGFTVATTDRLNCSQPLLHFDMSQVRSDATVLSATVSMTTSGPTQGATVGSPAGALTTQFVEGIIDALPFTASDYGRMDLGSTPITGNIAYNGLDGSPVIALNAAGITALNNKVPIGQGMKMTGLSVDLLNNLDYYLGSSTDNRYNTALILTATLNLTLEVPDEGMMGVNF